jgi:hypothetical protein
MASPQRKHLGLLAEAGYLTHVGAVLEASRVAYECHEVAGRRQANDERGRVRYLGRLVGKARCVDGTEAVGTEVKGSSRAGEHLMKRSGLSADRIGYECGRKPAVPELFHMTKQHRGVRGALDDGVVCRITAPATHAPRRHEPVRESSSLP